jgi:hypothetical protein
MSSPVPGLTNVAQKKEKLPDAVIVVVALVWIAILQTPILLNLELLFQAPQLIPVFRFDEALVDTFLTFAASAFLIFRARSLRTREWWIAFAAMMIPYLALKAVGVYWDIAQYLIAEAQGRHVGGGAAFGHLFLFVYILGPAQVLSAIIFFFVRRSK